MALESTVAHTRTWRDKLRLSSAHAELHKAVYALCFPAAVAGVNAVVYYVLRGDAEWPASKGEGAAWAADTFVAPWFAAAATIGATLLFIQLARHRRVRRSARIVTALVVTLAWLLTALSFLIVE